MKIIKKLNIKKIFRSLKTGVLSTNIFLVLFIAFFSTLALAATLTLTHKDNRIPSSAPGCFSSQTGFELSNDRTQNPRDVIWSDDGTMVFTVNKDMQGGADPLNLSMNKVSTPFELNTVKTFLGTHTCDDIDGFNPKHSSFTAQGANIQGGEFRSIHIAQGGKIFYIQSSRAEVIRYDLSTPFDFRTARYVQEFDFNNDSIGGFSMSRDGTKLYSILATDNTPTLVSYSLSTAFDITSATQIHSVDLRTIGIADDTSTRDIEFNDDGSAMFISVFKGSDHTNSIQQFRLGKNFDVSTATHVGGHDFLYHVSPGGALRAADTGKGYPAGHGIIWGFSFSSDGMKLFTLQVDSNQTVDHIYQFDLECPYGIVQCTSDTLATTGAQVELAKQNIIQNVSVIFKRFEWIKRNRDQEDLSSHNINLNYPNPILEALAMKLEPTTKRTIAKFVSTFQKKEKKSKWSSWSLGDISIGDYDKHGFEKQKKIKTKGLIFGADRRLGQNKFLGWALRYGNSSSNIRNSVQGVDMESVTLNLYGTIPRDDYRYINVVLGLSALSFDNMYIGKLSGERNGKQAFTSINYRTRNTYGILNITPTLKLDYGVTRLSKYTDYISTTIDGPATDIRYAEDTFKSGEFATGFLFETEKIDIDLGTFQPMGSIEYIYDLTPDIDYKYTLQGETIVNKDRILGKYSEASLKTNIGFELIYLNGFTLSPSYERIFSLSHDNDSRKFFSERFLVKISRSKQDDSQFALNIEPITGSNEGSLSFVKNINGFDFKINSNYKLKNNIDYLTNFEISGKF